MFDSRGHPTVEAVVTVEGGAHGRSIVPAGASTGRHEAFELRDGDSARHAGLGVLKAVANVNEVIRPRLRGFDVTDQTGLDQKLRQLDGTPDKSHLGANALLAVSLASAHAAASALGTPLWRYIAGDRQAALPMPMVNMLSGGLHAGGNLDVQDFLVIPLGASTYSHALEMCIDVYRSTLRLLREWGMPTLVGDEGGFGPRLPDNRAALQFLVDAIERSGWRPGADVALAVDVAASRLIEDDGSYLFALEGRRLTPPELIRMYEQWVIDFPIVSLEDPFAEDDWKSWTSVTEHLGATTQLVGDDLFTTSPSRLRMGADLGAGNAVLIKMNQIGTLTETLETIENARAIHYRAIVSARSGETEDTTMADLAVGTGVGQIKVGSVARSERLAKYNRLLRIESDLGNVARFAGREALGAG